MRLRPGRLGGLCATMIAAVAAVSHGQSQDPVALDSLGVVPAQPASELAQRPINELVTDLNSPRASVRIAATEALRTQSNLSLRDLENVLRTQKELSLEQRRRLTEAAFHRFKTEPRAAMGVRTSPMPGRSGVFLEFLTRGFPAEQVLKVNDRIETADGHKLDDFNLFRLIIIARDPGDEMPVTVIRDGALLNLKVKLGDYSGLRQPLDEATLVAAWRMYRAKDILESVEGLDAPLSPELSYAAWAKAGGEDGSDDEAALPAHQAANFLNDDRTALVVGGQARGGLVPGEGATVWRTRRFGPEFQIMNVPGDNRPNRQNDIRIELQMLQEARRTLEAQSEALKIRLGEGNLPEASRAKLLEQLDQNAALMQVYDGEIQRRSVQLRRP